MHCPLCHRYVSRRERARAEWVLDPSSTMRKFSGTADAVRNR
jgi:hypothetical protein